MQHLTSRLSTLSSWAAPLSVSTAAARGAGPRPSALARVRVVSPPAWRRLHLAPPLRASLVVAQRYDRETGALDPTVIQRTCRNLVHGHTPSVPLIDESLLDELPGGALVVEFGIGDGLSVPGLLSRGLRVLGIDQDASAITALREHWGAHPQAPSLRFLRGTSLAGAGLHAASAAYLRCCNVLPYLRDNEARALLDQALRALQPDGKAFITQYHIEQMGGWGIRRTVKAALAQVPPGFRAHLHCVQFEAFDHRHVALAHAKGCASVFSGMVLSDDPHIGGVQPQAVDAEIGAMARMLKDDGADYLVIRVGLVLEKPLNACRPLGGAMAAQP